MVHLTERRSPTSRLEPATDDEEKKTKEQDDEMVVNGEKPTRLWTVDCGDTNSNSKKLTVVGNCRNEMDA